MKLTITQWQQHVEAWRDSSLSQAAYCRQHGLNNKSFSLWTRKHPSISRVATVGFVPVTLEATVTETPYPVNLANSSASAAVTLRLYGSELALSTAVPPQWLAELLRCLA